MNRYALQISVLVLLPLSLTGCVGSSSHDFSEGERTERQVWEDARYQDADAMTRELQDQIDRQNFEPAKRSIERWFS